MLNANATINIALLDLNIKANAENENILLKFPIESRNMEAQNEEGERAEPCCQLLRMYLNSHLMTPLLLLLLLLLNIIL